MDIYTFISSVVASIAWPPSIGSIKPLRTLTFGKEKTTWSGEVKKTGDFVVVIDGTAKDSRYYVQLWIN
jgi:hypothetical protein